MIGLLAHLIISFVNDLILFYFFSIILFFYNERYIQKNIYTEKRFFFNKKIFKYLYIHSPDSRGNSGAR